MSFNNANKNTKRNGNEEWEERTEEREKRAADDE